MQNKRFLGILVVIGILLLIPFVAMKITGEVVWKPFDFVVAGVLLLGAGIAIEVALRLVTNFKHRIAVCVGSLAVLAVVWLELAVGIFGTPLAGS
jgi:hypothetical protein